MIVRLYSDISCPWATLAVHRLREARHHLGLGDDLEIDHRPFALELVNEEPTQKLTLDSEVPVIAGLSPEVGWRPWAADPSEWPVTTLPAMEAVQAGKEQGLRASEELDWALRCAFFVESRCISLRHVILGAAKSCELVDVDVLREALDSGRARSAVLQPVPEEVKGSPHLFLPDGRDAHNPGIEFHWEGSPGDGFPVVDSDAGVAFYEELLSSA